MLPSERRERPTEERLGRDNLCLSCVCVYVSDCDVCLLLCWKEIVWIRSFGSNVAKWLSSRLPWKAFPHSPKTPNIQHAHTRQCISLLPLLLRHNGRRPLSFWGLSVRVEG